jgi:hypothetical protein
LENNWSNNNNHKENINIPAITSNTTNNVIDRANNISENNKTIAHQTLIQLRRAGFRKLIPLFADSKRANVYDNLVTVEEIKQYPSAEGKPVRIIYENVAFWR